jgi:hypothetical protein
MAVLINLRTAVILWEQGPIFPDIMDKFNDLHGLDNGYLNFQNGNGNFEQSQVR